MSNTYALIVGLGASLGLLWSASRAPSEKQAARAVKAGLLALLGALIGARAGFVLSSWGYFSAHPAEIFALRLGGLSWVGATLGGLLMIGVLALAWNESLGELADSLLPLALLLAIGAWMGCWQAGCAYGAQAAHGVGWGIPALDESGQVASRLPLQPASALLTLLLFFVIGHYQAAFKRPGQAAAISALGMALILLAASALRADPAIPWLGWRVDGWAALGFVALGLAAIAASFAPSAGDVIHEKTATDDSDEDPSLKSA